MLNETLNFTISSQISRGFNAKFYFGLTKESSLLKVVDLHGNLCSLANLLPVRSGEVKQGSKYRKSLLFNQSAL